MRRGRTAERVGYEENRRFYRRRSERRQRLATFRDADGLWADYRIEEVCTPEALARNRALVVGFYNERRREMLAARPNAAHEAIARLERACEVEVVTQNVDDLHERAGRA